MYDIAVVGNGPAGCSCAITARMRGLDTVLIGPEEGILAKLKTVANYPGLPEITGSELLGRFRRQAKDMGAVLEDGTVRQIMPLGDTFMLLREQEVIEARTVVIATGAQRGSLLPGERELLGQGLSYCATCDGMFYRGKHIALLYPSKARGEDLSFLSGIAGSITLYGKAELEGAEILSDMPLRLAKDEDGRPQVITADGARSYDGIFAFRPALPADMLLEGLGQDGASVRTDRMMAASVPGVFAAGDCTGGPLQIAKAVGEGNIAALSASAYLGK